MTILPRRGVVVNVVSLDEVRGYYEILGSLESSALLSVFDKIQNSHTEQMDDLNAEQKYRLLHANTVEFFDLKVPAATQAAAAE